MSIEARIHLMESCRQLSPLIEMLPVLTINQQPRIHPVNAISEVVIGQMLSRSAARSIQKRAYDLSASNGRSFIAELSIDELRSAGLSSNKIKTIKFIYDAYKADPHRINSWEKLTYLELRTDVSSFWGISDWTASILALFYFGNPDIFPSNDGSIIKVIKKLQEHDISFEETEAKPYRSYLALYLWAILDNGLLELKK